CQLGNTPAVGVSAIFRPVFSRGRGMNRSRLVPQGLKGRGRDALGRGMRQARRLSVEVEAKIMSFCWQVIGPTFKISPSPLLEPPPDSLLPSCDRRFTSQADACE
ncbi:MAG: hypothetical protein ACPL7D_09285, partial [Candidatus Sumerlaeaceae bacterium]